MARIRSSLGLFGRFGRSQDLRQLDHALRAVDVHPGMVPEAVKLTVVNLLKDHAVDDEPAPRSYEAAAELLAYCMIGAEGFAGANGAALAVQVEERMQGAVDQSDSLDAQLALVTMAARVIHPNVIERFQLTSEAE
jgi:hypothetical protein